MKMPSLIEKLLDVTVRVDPGLERWEASRVRRNAVVAEIDSRIPVPQER
jgi:hypothetical protein